MHQEPVDRSRVREIVGRHRGDPSRLVQILWEVQDTFGWLSEGALDELARALGLSLAQIRSTASFYHFFHLRPMGAYRVLFSDNITDRMLGSEGAARAFMQQPVAGARRAGHHKAQRGNITLFGRIPLAGCDASDGDYV